MLKTDPYHFSDLADEEFDIGDVISKDNLNITPYNIREGDEETVSDDMESIPQRDSFGSIIEHPRSGTYTEVLNILPRPFY